MQDFMRVCEQAARAGAEVLMDWRGQFSVRTKGPKDLVTEADGAAQEAIRDVLLSAFPTHQFVGEEDDDLENSLHTSDGKEDEPEQESPFRWIVDPLDGTINYVHGLPSYAVSIGLERQGELLVGVVYNPLLDECFSAITGGGAWMNGTKLTTSGCMVPDEALIAASLPAGIAGDCVEMRRFIEVSHGCQSIRRLGSAALNLCYVACGRLDAYFASTVKPWDVAAGVLMVREAGGVVSSLDGGVFDIQRPHFTCAATEALHASLLEMLARAE
jgi:myo-inositol-1(or 4)-monophosphatase